MASDDEIVTKDLKTGEDGNISNQSSKLEMDFGNFAHEDPYNLASGYSQVGIIEC